MVTNDLYGLCFLKDQKILAVERTVFSRIFGVDEAKVVKNLEPGNIFPPFLKEFLQSPKGRFPGYIARELEYRSTIYALLILSSLVILLSNWLHKRYCFRHHCHKVQAGDQLVCPHCHTPNLHH